MAEKLDDEIRAADMDARYDEKAKSLLGHKIVLAHILVKTVNEFKGMAPEDVVSYIEGEPYISLIPTEPGMTNTETDVREEKVIGFNSENAEVNEGMVRFDIVFYVRTKDGLAQIIVNLEAQRKEPKKYDILNRAVFYVSRLISSQKGRDFTKTDYDDICSVYSIWLCMSMEKNSMAHIHLVQDDIVDSVVWKGRMDLINIVMIGLADELPEHDDRYELHRLLGTLLSDNMKAESKIDIIRNEYGITVGDDIRKDVEEMGSLSQGIREKGRQEGWRDGEANIIIKMHKNGYSVEEIAGAVDKTEEEIRRIVEGRSAVLA